MRAIQIFHWSLAVALLMAVPVLAAPSFHETQVRLRDGIELTTFVYVDDAQGPLPVVMARTPYFIKNGKLDALILNGTAEYFLKRGYNFVVQAVRGTPPSAGAYMLFNPQEIEDARDTLDWIADQSFCNGSISAVGTSYEGYTALAAAITNHPNLKVVFAGGSPSGLGLHTFQSQGVITTQLIDYMRYNYLQTGNVYDPNLPPRLLEPEIFAEADPSRYDDVLFGKDIPDWNEMARNFNDPQAPIWTDRSIRNRLLEIRVPTFHIAGSRSDADNRDVLSNFKWIEALSPYSRVHRLIIGPWNHGNSTPYIDGSNLSPFMARRFDSLHAHFMKGIPSPYMNEKRVLWELSPNGRWIESEKFPMDGTVRQTVYLHENSRADLTMPSPSERTSTKYNYLPLLPTTLASGEMATFEYRVQKPEVIIGEFKAELFVRPNRPVSDVFLWGEIERASGETDLLAYCMLGAKVVGANSIQELVSGDCPINTHLNAGDRVTIKITGKLFPSFFKTFEIEESGKHVFRDGAVEILHSENYPSSVSWHRLAVTSSANNAASLRPSRPYEDRSRHQPATAP